MAQKIGRKSGGSRKVGRNVVKCKRYRDENRREKNKKRKALKLKKKYAKNRERRLLQSGGVSNGGDISD